MKKNMIIVGAGLAGLSAALQAVKEGCSVKLISSLPSERAQSVMAEGGINAALNTKGEDDSTQEHYEDTIKAGCNLADPNAVWNMTQAAPEVVKWLHSMVLPQLSVLSFLYYRKYSIINISKDMREAVKCQVHTVHYV